MPKPPPEPDYKARFIARARELREMRGYTQAYVAEMIDAPYENYKKWEKDRYIPHYWIARFAGLMGVSVHYLMTGHEPVDKGQRARPRRAVGRKSTRLSLVPPQ